jgi:hypothetical protein
MPFLLVEFLVFDEEWFEEEQLIRFLPLVLVGVKGSFPKVRR